MVLLAILALQTVGADSPSSSAKFEGVFGYKFGERIPSTMPTVPSNDGTLLAEIEPQQPEVDLKDYFLAVLPKSRQICGFVAVSELALTDREKVVSAYSGLIKSLVARFGKMKKFPASDAGMGESVVTLRNDMVLIGKDRMVMAQLLKAPGNYQIRFLALDITLSKSAMKECREMMQKVRPLEGLFGKKLGARMPVADDETKLANGACLQVFEPDKRFLDFEVYLISGLPQSRKIFAIVAVRDGEDRFDALQSYEKVLGLLEKKFGLKLVDCTSNYDTDKPDADGEQMLKAAAATFPMSMRSIEVQCFYDVDDKAFRVRIIARDNGLVSLLEKEVKESKKAQSEKDALDAL